MKLLFFDIDGTIFFDGKISRRNIDALRRVQSAGNRLIIDTGRSLAYLPCSISKDICWDGMILGTSYAELDGDVICDEVFGRDTLLALWDYCEQSRTLCKYEGVDVMYLQCSTQEHRNALEAQKRLYDGLIWRDPSREYISEHSAEMRVTKCAIMGSVPKNGENPFPGIWMVDMGSYAELYLNGFDKATCMKLIGDRLGVGREDMIAFGDSANDEGMLRFAGTRAIMDSAPRELTDIADVVMKSDPEGVAEGLERLFPELF